MRQSVALFRSLLSHLRPFYFYYKASAAPAASRRSLHLNQAIHFYSDLSADLLTLFANLSKNPNNPKILSLVDSILTQSHLLDSTASVLVLRGLAQSNKLTRAKNLLSSLRQRGQIPILFLYTIVLQCLLPRSHIRDVECAWSEVFGESTLERFVFYASMRCDDTLDVEPLCRRLLSCQWELSRNASTALIGALCLKKNPDPGLAREVLRGMVERALEVDDLSYYTVFGSFCRIGDLSGADSMLKEMYGLINCGLDLLVYEDFLGCLCKAGKFREARKLFDKMSRSAKRHGSSLGTNVKPGRRIIFQLSSSNMISETMAFEAYFRSLCSYGRLEEAESLLKEATRKYLVTGVCVMKSFVNALFSAGRHEEAIRFFNAERKRRGVSVGDLATTVIVCLCGIDRVDDGYELGCDLVNEGYVLTAWVWNLIMKRYWEDGKTEKAMDIFEGIKLGTLCAFLRPDGSTYAIMINGFLRVGMIEKATTVLEEMRREKFAASVDLYLVLVRNLHLCGRSKEALGYLNYMIENGVFVSYTQWEVMFESLTSINCAMITSQEKSRKTMAPTR
ncbi:pentatricopeptide repeat-containing protein At5g61990, mitochondrial [Dendrobium catenatum]|uniref:Pentatricopeptide repeat-containing protein n=1 Tax=Dendrobium catenatum TaxID=906689 RepID=A0A2I0XJ36_9ASPA|nr:pentatricopeptide repeat-containing protein At5g61990, mitochondrial [Dendrobium catenatum]PKU87927.1 Pentatricopeptide repeat-containing protein [Dendrobium catenatum]